jgi:TIR domain
MADIFISYSHKDTDIVRDLVPALQAEGFSVWWDHTIPPGKTWDDVIATGIRDAKACIIVWSSNSVVSDWVKEEATIAKEGNKYLPVQVGADLPPLGFRRIQSADLRNWDGNAKNPQWRMLVTEIANLVGAAAQTPVMLSKPADTPPVEQSRKFNARPSSGIQRRAWFIGIAVVTLVAAATAWWTFSGRGSTSASALATFNNSGAPSIVGVWNGWYHLDTDQPGMTHSLIGTFQQDGTMVGQSEGRISSWQWRQSGTTAQWSNGSTSYNATVNGGHMVGTISFGQHTGNFEATR